MDKNANEFWNKVSPGLRQYRNLVPPTPEEAEAELLAASSDPLPEERIQEILSFAVTGKKPKRRLADLVPDWLKEIDLGAVNQDMVLALARNAGASDDEIEKALQQLRQEAFEELAEDGEDGVKES